MAVSYSQKQSENNVNRENLENSSEWRVNEVCRQPNIWEFHNKLVQIQLSSNRQGNQGQGFKTNYNIIYHSSPSASKRLFKISDPSINY